MLNLPAQAGFRAEGAWHRAGAWGPCAAGKLAAAHTSPGRCSLRLSLLSSPHPVGGTETSLQDSRPLSGGHPSIRACLRGRQGSREQGCWTPHPPRWRLDGPTLPKLPEGLVSHEHRPGSPRVREEAAAPRILGGPGSCIPVGTFKGLVCWSLHAKGTRGARRRAGGLPAGLVWGPPGHRARSPRAGCLLPGARVTPGQGWDGGNRSGDTPRP